MSLILSIRILLSVSASAIQKRLVLRGTPHLGVWTATYAMMLPIACVAAGMGWTWPPRSFWSDSVLGGGLDALGNIAMLAAMRFSDLSVFGPLNAIRPILALFFGWMFLNETPTAHGLGGIVITMAGAAVVLKGDGGSPHKSAREVGAMLGFRILGLALSTVASVFLKRAASATSAEMTLAGWILSGLVCLVGYGLLTKQAVGFREERGWLVSHALVFLVMQWLTIKIFQATLLSYAFVFFQLGMILQTVAGRYFFDEPHFGRRLGGWVALSFGAVLILWRG